MVEFGTSSAFRGWVRVRLLGCAAPLYRLRFPPITTKPGVPRQGLGFWAMVLE